MDGIGTSYSSFVPDHCNAKIIYLRIGYRLPGAVRRQLSADKTCDSLNPYAPHNK
jgi:hypothetical protein